MKTIHEQLALELLQAYGRQTSRPDAPFQEKVVQAGETIIHQDSPIANIFLILSGSMKIHMSTQKGNEYLVAIEGPGELTGEVEALTGDDTTCSVTALTQSKIAVIPQQTYKTWLANDHEFALTVNKILCRRLQLVTKRAVTHLTYPLEYSVLKLFKMLADENDSSILTITKDEIANYLGTNVRSINRILKDLQHKNVLADSKRIEILSIDALLQTMQLHEN